MTNNFVLLNNVEHQNVKIITKRSAIYGDSVHFAMTFPIEFRRVQSCYPIFFQKDADTGKFFPIALFGFEADENLFLNEDGWDANYIPLMIRRHPFLIGFQKAREEADEKSSVVSIDMGSPRVNETEGEALFLPHGGTSQYLASMIQVLEDIKVGHEMNSLFIEALLELDLIESVSMEIELNDGSKRQLLGLYTINEERLEQLDSDALAKLHRRQFLQPVYMILASFSSFRTLIDRRNDQLAAL
jgi:hypothetical protein